MAELRRAPKATMGASTSSSTTSSVVTGSGEWDKPLWEHDLAGGLRTLRMGVDTHIITAHAALPLLLRSDRGLLVEMTDGTAEVNQYRERVGFFYDLVKANVSRSSSP